MKPAKSPPANSRLSNRKVLCLISVFLRSSSRSLPSTASPPGHLQIIFSQTLQSQVLPVIHQHPPLSAIRIKAPHHSSPPPPPLISLILNITLQYAFYISCYHLFNCICCTQKMLRIWIMGIIIWMRVTDCSLNVYSNSSHLQKRLSEVMFASLKHLKGGRSP